MLPFGELEDVHGQDPTLVYTAATQSEATDTSAHPQPVNPVNAASLAQALKSNAEKSRKRKGKRMKPAPQAHTVTRGFQTPTSCGDASDGSPMSTPKVRPALSTRPSSNGHSPLIRASSLTHGISELRLTMSRQASSAGFDTSAENIPETTIEHDDGKESARSCDTVEVPISRDFAADDKGPQPLHIPIEGGLRRNSPHRKMTADDFEPLKCLGKGAYGTVILVRQHSTGRLFAQKQLKKASLTVAKHLVEQTKNERSILQSVNRHPFVVKLFYAFQDHQKLYLILEYAQGGELFHHLAMERTFTEEVSAFYMAEMVLALEYLHQELGVVYRDLKPENCLLDAEGHLLLTDFGLSKVALDEDGAASRCNSILGTVDYMAPEVVQGKMYDAVVDWWSLGALGYDLLTGAPPFASANHTKTEQKIIHGKITMPYYLSPDAKDLLTRLLRKEPKKRLGGNMPQDLNVIKKHRFFRRIDWVALANRELIAPIQPIITDPEAAENFDAEFTNAMMSPIEGRLGDDLLVGGSASHGENPFGGFSFVASKSLLECGLE